MQSWKFKIVTLTGFRWPPLDDKAMKEIEFPLEVEITRHRYTFPMSHEDYTVQIGDSIYGIGWFETTDPEINRHNEWVSAMHDKYYAEHDGHDVDWHY